MLRYAAVAAASKAFSLSPTTRRVYRRLGNVALARQRTGHGPTQPYLDRSRRLVELCDRHAALRPGDRVLELGTGWLHWEATVLRLFFDVRVTLFDVWDNRLFSTYLDWVARFGEHLTDPAWSDLDPSRLVHARELVERIGRVGSFDELYALLGFTYVLEPHGRLEGLDRAYALVVSADVMEHIPAADLPTCLAACHDRLVPGGYAIHQIDLVDHFHYFDPTTSPKHHFRYDDRAWRRWFDSDVQYVNRVQPPTWRQLFADAGFRTVEEQRISRPLGPVPRAPEFADLDTDDVDCLQLVTVHRTTGERP